jgi:hypothetical protein
VAVTQSRRILETILVAERETRQRVNGKNGGTWKPYLGIGREKDAQREREIAQTLAQIRAEVAQRMAL